MIIQAFHIALFCVLTLFNTMLAILVLLEIKKKVILTCSSILESPQLFSWI